jgi:CMP-N-acetylneuraminic acid synthetase
MKVVAMIPIKLNSERIPLKNLKRFSDGTPLVSFIQAAALNAKNVSEVYVYCSSEQIKDYLLPGVIFLQRPDYLDANSANSNDIIREFIREVDADIYVNSHATGPFTRSESIDACITQVASGNYDSAFLARRMQEFLWCDGQALNFDIQHFPRTQDLNPIYSETPGAYVFSKEIFFKYGRRVGIKPYIHTVSEIESRDIDNPEDFELANAIYKEIICKRS